MLEDNLEDEILKLSNDFILQDLEQSRRALDDWNVRASPAFYETDGFAVYSPESIQGFIQAAAGCAAAYQKQIRIYEDELARRARDHDCGLYERFCPVQGEQLSLFDD